MPLCRTETQTSTARPAGADLFNKPIEEMRAAKEAEVELPECLKREATAEETARIAEHAKDASPERESRCPIGCRGFFTPLGDNLNRLTRCTLSRKKSQRGWTYDIAGRIALCVN